MARNFAQLIFSENENLYKIAVPKLIHVNPFAFMMQKRVHKYLQNIEKKFRPIKYIVDVGACVGAISLPYSLIFPDANILAIEPSKMNYPFLEFNTKDIPQIKRIKMAVGDVKNKVRISAPSTLQRTEPEEDLDTGLISIYGASEKYAEIVECDLLDNIVGDKVDWLKIDVEGYEIPVLEGAKNIIQEQRPILQIECREDNQGYSHRSVGQLLGEVFKHNYPFIGEIRGDIIFIPGEYL